MQTIVAIDDREANREFLATLLAYRGYRVVVARDALEGLDAVRRERPALVICDVLMPGVDGFEFVRRLRHEPEIAATEVVFCTAYFHEHEAHRLAQRCGVRHVLAKPCEPEQLLAIVDRLLRRSTPDSPDIPDSSFHQQHLRLLTDKLSSTQHDLERANRDLAEQLLSEQGRQQLLQDKLAALSELQAATALRCAVVEAFLAGGPADALTQLLAALLDHLAASAAALWQVDGRAGRLHCRGTLSRHEAFAGCCQYWQGAQLRPAEDLAGRCWALAAPLWLGDPSHLAELSIWPVAQSAGLNAGLAFPVAARREPIAIVELWYRDGAPPSAEFLNRLSEIGPLIGRGLIRLGWPHAAPRRSRTALPQTAAE